MAADRAELHHGNLSHLDQPAATIGTRVQQTPVLSSISSYSVSLKLWLVLTNHRAEIGELVKGNDLMYLNYWILAYSPSCWHQYSQHQSKLIMQSGNWRLMLCAWAKISDHMYTGHRNWSRCSFHFSAQKYERTTVKKSHCREQGIKEQPTLVV